MIDNEAALQVEFASRASHWRPALVLGVAMGASTVLLVPYVLAVTGAPMHTMGLPPAVAVALSGVQNALLGFLMAWAGLRLGAPLALDAPLVRAWTSRRAFAGEAHWLWASLIGVVAGGLILGIDAVCFAKVVASAPAGMGHAARWNGALASFYGGTGEEVQLRLFFMTAIAWCLAKVTRSKADWVFVTAIVIAALAFGAGHLPATARVFGSLTLPLVVRALLLNGLAGLAFGAVYWRWGLEHAMVAHFCGDIVLHVIAGG